MAQERGDAVAALDQETEPAQQLLAARGDDRERPALGIAPGGQRSRAILQLISGQKSFVAHAGQAAFGAGQQIAQEAERGEPIGLREGFAAESIGLSDVDVIDGRIVPRRAAKLGAAIMKGNDQ